MEKEESRKSEDDGREADKNDENEENRSLLSSKSSISDRDQPQAEPEPRTTPRTPNRVRFALDEPSTDGPNGRVSRPRGTEWVEDEDYLVSYATDGRRDSVGHRTPLLTDIEAPSVTVASTGLDGRLEEFLEDHARPKSGMRSAFMNMANSIM